MLALDPRQRNERVNWRGAGRAADGCNGGAELGLIHHRRGQSAWAASGAAAAIYRRAGVPQVELRQVIVGGEEAFFTADEEERAGAGVVLMPQ